MVARREQKSRTQKRRGGTDQRLQVLICRGDRMAGENLGNFKGESFLSVLLQYNFQLR